MNPMRRKYLELKIHFWLMVVVLIVIVKVRVWQIRTWLTETIG